MGSLPLVGAGHCAGDGTPPQSNLTLWLRADSLTYSDSSLTTPATADGSAIAGWGNKVSGAGNANQTAGATYCPQLQLGVVNGKPAIVFDGAADYLTLLTSNVDLKFIHETGIFDLVFVVRRDTLERAGFLSSLITGAHQGLDMEFQADTGALTMILSKGSATNALKTTTTLLTTGQWYVVEILGDGTSIYMSTDLLTYPAGDQTTYINTPLGTGNATNVYQLGAIGGTISFPFEGAFAELLFYTTNLSGTNKTALKNYLISRYGAALTLTRKMACLGDSITQTAPARAPVPWPEMLEDTLGPTWSVANYGVSGATCSTATTVLTTDIIGKGYEETTVLIGVNDCILGSETAAQIYARIYNGTTGIVDRLLADGQRVNLLTILPFNNYASGDETKRQKARDVNTLIRALNVSNVTIIDSYASMGDTADATQLSYQGAGKSDYVTFSDSTRDFLHIGPGGCTAMSAIVAAGRAQV